MGSLADLLEVHRNPPKFSMLAFCRRSQDNFDMRLYALSCSYSHYDMEAFQLPIRRQVEDFNYFNHFFSPLYPCTNTRGATHLTRRSAVLSPSPRWKTDASSAWRAPRCERCTRRATPPTIACSTCARRTQSSPVIASSERARPSSRISTTT